MATALLPQAHPTFRGHSTWRPRLSAYIRLARRDFSGLFTMPGYLGPAPCCAFLFKDEQEALTKSLWSPLKAAGTAVNHSHGSDGKPTVMALSAALHWTLKVMEVPTSNTKFWEKNFLYWCRRAGNPLASKLGL